MLKFKMSLLLKSAKFRVAVATLTIAAILAGIIMIPKNKANSDSTTLVAGAYASGVSVKGITYWKITGSQNNIYCIQEGERLNSENTYYTVGQDFSASGEYFTNHAAAKWLIDNMYIPGNDTDEHLNSLVNILTSENVKARAKVSGVTAQDITALKSVKIGNGTYSDYALNIVNQIVLWNFTKNKAVEISGVYENENNYFENTSLTDSQQKALKYTYYALKILAEEHNVSTYPTTSSYVLDKQNAKFNEENYRVGPYAVTVNGTQDTANVLAKYPIAITVTRNDGSKVNAGKELVEEKDGAFYINLEAYKDDVKNVEFKIDNIVQPDGVSTSATVYPGYLGFQHLMTVSRQGKNKNITLSDSVSIVIEKPEGKYNVILKKVKDDGTTVITSSEATFKVNGNEKQTSKGILNIEQGKKIEDVNQNATYEISETKAPEGYTPFDGTLKLDVKFKEVNKTFMIDKEKTTTEGFTNGTKIDVSEEKGTITITVPNKELPKPGKYNVELYKVDTKGNIIETPAKFKVNGEEKTTNKGVISIAKDVVVNDETTVGKYFIEETQAPANYKMLAGSKINLNVKMTKVGNDYLLKEDGITFNVEEPKTEEYTFLKKLMNVKPSFKLDGSTIKVYVPNMPEEFDLSLRKYISKIDGEEVSISREPIINEQSIKNLEETGTASYYHIKDSIGVSVGSEVEFTIRVYNEGEILGLARQITDYLPEGLTFVRIADESKGLYTTTSEVGSRVVVLNYTGNTVIKSLRDFISQKTFNITNEYYQEVKIICKVENTNVRYITSRSEITNYGYISVDSEGKSIWKEAVSVGNVDKDSAQNTIKDSLELDTWYEKAEERTYIDKNGNKATDKNYYPGVQDDDDFETVELLTGKYNIIIKKVDAVDGKTTLPGAYFKVNGSNIDKEVGPTSANGEVTVIDGVKIENDKQVDSYTIKETKAPVDYKLYDGEIKVKVATKYNGKTFVIDEKNTTVNGKDIKFSTNNEKTTLTIVVPNNKKKFDLSLRKYITEVNGVKPETSREPQVDTSKLASGESTTATYNHTKDALYVNTNDIVTYTIRVYNEGEIDGYATKVMDDIPEGLEFLPDNELNKSIGWVMYKEVKNKTANSVVFDGKNYEVTKNAKEADIIVTNYLKESAIKAFNADSKTLDYKDVKVAFKVVEPTTSDRIVTNYAQIVEHTDLNGKVITDIDSTPNEWIKGEDDQDIENIKVRYFDLALRKWVTKAIVYENGTENVTETKHGPWDDPEPVVKVDIKNKSINDVKVKFEYTIRVYNQGEAEASVAGYAKEISDYIPEGLKFVQEDNPQWKEVDGKIVTRALENTLLKPGEYADVKVILTWINGADNLGLKTNVAEISEDYNDFGIHDIDSTPNNQVKGEDDIDDAPVILTVRTGTPIVYTGVVIAALGIVSLGAVVIKRKILA